MRLETNSQGEIDCNFGGEMSETVTKTKTEKCKVLIIGAGMAGNFVVRMFHSFSKFINAIILLAMPGLSAASHLAKNGLSDFKILEARNRIGGRIISIEMGQQRVSEKIVVRCLFVVV